MITFNRFDMIDLAGIIIDIMSACIIRCEGGHPADD